MSSLKDTIEKIKNLEAEKKNLLLEIEELKKMADAKATSLESEIASLREEAKALKVLMGQEPSVSRLKVS
jgi:predicted  nucleic acid-binding Zn-ribbon protein